LGGNIYLYQFTVALNLKRHEPDSVFNQQTFSFYEVVFSCSRFYFFNVVLAEWQQNKMQKKKKTTKDKNKTNRKCVQYLCCLNMLFPEHIFYMFYFHTILIWKRHNFTFLFLNKSTFRYSFILFSSLFVIHIYKSQCIQKSSQKF
jgi:hypothetical protein